MRIYPFLLLCIFLSGCFSSSYTGSSFGSLYNGKVSSLQPEYKVVHNPDGTTSLWFRVNSKDMLYTRANQASTFNAEMQFTYQVYTDFKSKTLLDSARTKLVDLDNEQTPKELIGKIDLKVTGQEKYVMQITARDMHRKTEKVSVLTIDRRPHTRQYFHVSDTASEVPLFTNNLVPGQQVTIKNGQHQGKLFGRYYLRDFPLAAPPFSMYGMTSFHYKADSTFEIQPNAAGTFDFTLPKKGFVHLQSDTSEKKGLTLFVFTESFPEVITHEDMVPPLRYLTSRNEFNELQLAKNKQTAVEKFWVRAAGSKARAKESIRKFYVRVRSANFNFTSYVEGWKTDRGLIHIIYGHPKTIYHNDDSEVWIYGEEQNINSIVFTFRKVNNPFTENDYTLERHPNFKTNWYRALDSWRNGRSFTNY